MATFPYSTVSQVVASHMSDWTWPSGKTGEAVETLRAFTPSEAVQPETELVLGLQAGSQEAFSWLVSHYHSAVYNLVYSMLGNSGDAPDVTQENLKVFRGIPQFQAWKLAQDLAVPHRRPRSPEPAALVLAPHARPDFDHRRNGRTHGRHKA